MKKINFITVFAIASMFAACQTTSPTKSVEMKSEINELKHFPSPKEGMERYVISLADKGIAEENYQIELVPGKNMEVDCNRHILNGNITEKNLDGFGYTYYEFSSNGQAASTRMACPENTKTTKFVFGETLLVRYNSKLPIVVYVPKGFELKYKVWEASKEVSAKIITAADLERVKTLQAFPKAEGDKSQYVIEVEKKSNEMDYKVEIVPGKLAKVDCNRQFLAGELVEKDIQGYGYSYYEFNTNGNIASTMMACPDNTLTEKFVAAQAKIVRYNSNLPVVIYTPKDCQVQYKIWTAGNLKDSKVL